MMEIRTHISSRRTQRHKILFEIDSPKTYASYLALADYYWKRDPANPINLIGFSRSILRKIKSEFGSITCYYCKRPNLVIAKSNTKKQRGSQKFRATIDHIIPISRGGSPTDPNKSIRSSTRSSL